MDSVEARQCLAAGPRLALVARHGRIVEIIAAGALAQIATGRRLVAQLTAGASQNCARQQGIITPDTLIGGAVAVGYQRTDPQTSVVGIGEFGKVQPIDVDQLVGSHHLEFHEIEQIGSARDIKGIVRRLRSGSVAVACSGIGKGLHDFSPAT